MNIPWEAIIGLGIYIAGSTVGFIWWMAVQTTTLQFVREDLQAARKMLEGFETTYAKSLDVAKDIGRVEQSVQAAHKRIDMWTK